MSKRGPTLYALIRKKRIIGSHRTRAGEGAEGEGDRTPVDVGRRRRKIRPRRSSAPPVHFEIRVQNSFTGFSLCVLGILRIHSRS